MLILNDGFAAETFGLSRLILGLAAKRGRGKAATLLTNNQYQKGVK